MNALAILAGAIRGAFASMDPAEADAIRGALAERLEFARESFQCAKRLGASLADVAEHVEQAQRALEAFNRAHPVKR